MTLQPNMQAETAQLGSFNFRLPYTLTLVRPDRAEEETTWTKILQSSWTPGALTAEDDMGQAFTLNAVPSGPESRSTEDGITERYSDVARQSSLIWTPCARLTGISTDGNPVSVLIKAAVCHEVERTVWPCKQDPDTPQTRTDHAQPASDEFQYLQSDASWCLDAGAVEVRLDDRDMRGKAIGIVRLDCAPRDCRGPSDLDPPETYTVTQDYPDAGSIEESANESNGFMDHFNGGSDDDLAEDKGSAAICEVIRQSRFLRLAIAPVYESDESM